MKTKTKLLIMGSVIAFAACQETPEPRYQVKAYPETYKDTTVVDDYFGTKVADPYRWLENDTSEQTMAWVKAQQAVTDEYLSHIPFRAAIKDRLTNLMNYERYSVPGKRFGRYIYSKNDGLQNQSVIYIQYPGKDPEVLLDPNKLSDDGTVSYGGGTQSNDGKYFAYTIQRSGSDWVEIYVMDIATKELLPDHIEWAKFGRPTLL